MEVKYTKEELRILTTPICKLSMDDREELKKLLSRQGCDLVIID